MTSSFKTSQVIVQYSTRDVVLRYAIVQLVLVEHEITREFYVCVYS